jgi:thioredoxin 1
MNKFASLLGCLLSSCIFTSCSPKQTPQSQEETRHANIDYLNNESELHTLLDTYDKVIVDFYADWCGPCKRLTPIIDKVARDQHDIKFAKVNTEHAPSLVNQFGIRSIPTLLFFKNGTLIKRTQGLMSEVELKNAIKQAF